MERRALLASFAGFTMASLAGCSAVGSGNCTTSAQLNISLDDPNADAQKLIQPVHFDELSEPERRLITQTTKSESARNICYDDSEALQRFTARVRAALNQQRTVDGGQYQAFLLRDDEYYAIYLNIDGEVVSND